MQREDASGEDGDAIYEICVYSGRDLLVSISPTVQLMHLQVITSLTQQTAAA